MLPALCSSGGSLAGSLVAAAAALCSSSRRLLHSPPYSSSLERAAAAGQPTHFTHPEVSWLATVGCAPVTAAWCGVDSAVVWPWLLGPATLTAAALRLLLLLDRFLTRGRWHRACTTRSLRSGGKTWPI